MSTCLGPYIFVVSFQCSSFTREIRTKFHFRHSCLKWEIQEKLIDGAFGTLAMLPHQPKICTILIYGHVHVWPYQGATIYIFQLWLIFCLIVSLQLHLECLHLLTSSTIILFGGEGWGEGVLSDRSCKVSSRSITASSLSQLTRRYPLTL